MEAAKGQSKAITRSETAQRHPRVITSWTSQVFMAVSSCPPTRAHRSSGGVHHRKYDIFGSAEAVMGDARQLMPLANL